MPCSRDNIKVTFINDEILRNMICVFYTLQDRIHVTILVSILAIVYAQACMPELLKHLQFCMCPKIFLIILCELMMVASFIQLSTLYVASYS